MPDPEEELALVCTLAGNVYAIPLGDVVEVTRAVAVTTPSGDAGVTIGYIDLRGDLVPVVSGRMALALPLRDIQIDDRFVVVRADGRLAAIEVDGVEGVERIAVPEGPGSVSGRELTITRRLTTTEGSAVITRIDVRSFVPDPGSASPDAAGS
jgi:chemotaxis signal transduction protein